MTAFERLEHQLPELMTELAPPRVPDYFASLLEQTARTPQRPAWASLERWLPVDVTHGNGGVRMHSWRWVAVGAFLALVALAGTALVTGFRPIFQVPPVPSAAAVLVVGTADGDIVAFEPTTGATRTLIGGPTFDRYPSFSPDGRRLVFLRTGPAPDFSDGVFIAAADGSGVRQLGSWGDACCSTADWAPTGDRVMFPGPVVFDVDQGASTWLDVGLQVMAAAWLPDGRRIVVRATGLAPADTGMAFYVVDVESRAVERIALAPDAIDGPALSADGSTLAYASWADGPGLQGRIHFVDVASGLDRTMLFEGSEGTVELAPRFSPDGTRLLIERSVGPTQFRLALVPLDQPGPVIALGSTGPLGFGGSTAVFSPDGSTIIATVDTGAAWLLDASGGEARELPWSETQGQTWQPVAP